MNAPAEPPLLLSHLDNSILRLTLNRARARNALSSALMAALQEALDGVSPAARVIVIAAEGPVFCAGHDLRELSGHRADSDSGHAAFAALFAQCSALMQGIVRHPLPVIAEVQGLATAAGCQLVASCDLAVASSAAGFATPGVDIGLFCSTPMVALSRNLSHKAAMEMLLTGEPVTATRARELGLVTKVVAPELLTEHTMALAAKIASKPRATVRTGKEAFYRQSEMPLAEAYDYASQVMTQNMMAAEAEEGICAFLEKARAAVALMFQQLLRAFTAPEPRPPADLRMAVAVLLIEAAYRDDVFQPEERTVIARLLQQKFSLSQDEAATLLAAAEDTCRNSVQLHPHTSAVAEQMTAEERIHFVEMMWEVAYADGVLDPEEDALIRRMVNLIHITDRDRVLARQRVLARIEQNKAQ